MAEDVDRFDHRRLHGEIGLVLPAGHEDTGCGCQLAGNQHTETPSRKRTR